MVVDPAPCVESLPEQGVQAVCLVETKQRR
ncbi:hypothetical protein A2U01_0111501, partial [Trifolium medium]|nr:hypothetical protein [Trifolium medium]